MQYRTIKKTAEKISTLGFGCMRLPCNGSTSRTEFSNKIDVEKSKKQIFDAIDSGLNYIDTAYPYHRGASEKFLGEHILNTDYRKKINIATKLPCMFIKKKEDIEKYFNIQLERLGIDCIDYYLLHSLNGATFDKMLDFGIIDFMDKIKREGKVRNMGFSFHGEKSAFMKIVDSYDFDFVQIQYNIIDEHFQAGIEGIEYAGKKGLGVVIMEPLRGGSLVDKIPKEVEKIWKSSKIERTPADWALRYILNNPYVTTILSGMNNEEHIKENLKVATETLPNSLTDEELDVIRKVKSKYDELLLVKCTGCAYCLPCPQNIDIPSCFKNLNNYNMFGKFNSIMFHASFSGMNGGKAHWASSCTKCGKCEKACPQNLSIINDLKLVSKTLEKPYVKVLASVGRKFM